MASIVDTSVKHAYSAMAGASVISGTAGSLITALDAFLVTGWGSKAVDSAVISNGVCRLNFASGKSAAEAHAVIVVAGATPSALNGEQKVTAVANGWVEFKTALPDGAVTGAMSFKMAPLGWEKVFAATNKAVYRPVDPRGTRPFVRVDDSSAQSARLQMFEAMTDVDTGVASTPTAAQIAGGVFWPKSDAASANARAWRLFGDSMTLRFWCAPAAGGSTGVMFEAGDIIPVRSGDAYSAILSGGASQAAVITSGGVVPGCTGYAAGTDVGADCFITRAFSGIGAAQLVKKTAAYNTAAAYSGQPGYCGHALQYPNPVDNSLRISPIDLLSGGLRGQIAGAYHCYQQLGNAFSNGDVLSLTINSSTRVLQAVRLGPPSGSQLGTVFVDITGPWRD